jgi:hypothetical protein
VDSLLPTSIWLHTSSRKGQPALVRGAETVGSTPALRKAGLGAKRVHELTASDLNAFIRSKSLLP